MIDTVDAYAPNFARSVLGYEALSPLDLERRFGLVGGDIFHGALGLDQLFSTRPLLGQAQLSRRAERACTCAVRAAIRVAA
jgi:phytoene dehydrogenase-like protein